MPMKSATKQKVRVMLAMAALSFAGCGGYDGAVDPSLSSFGMGDGGTGVTSLFDAPSEMSAGDIMPIEFNGTTSASVEFADVPADAEFILAIGSLNQSGSGSTISVVGDVSLPMVGSASKGMSIESGEDVSENGEMADDGFGPGEILSAWLRASESELPSLEMPANEGFSPSESKSADIKAQSLGGTESFRVLSSLSSTSSYVDVTGKVRCVGEHVVFYVDTSVPDSVLAESDVSSLCNEFDSVAGREQGMLGSTSDVDGDGKFHVLMTKQVNRLGALGGGIITGYFYAGDLYARSGSNPVSNNREVIYTMVPDPDGSWGTDISRDFAMDNLLPAVLPHELQHAISYNQHVFVSGGASEQNWLNEGMSHLMEDVMGYGMENPSRYAMFLSSPSSYGVVTQGSPNLMERGAAYLFLRYLYEQAADGDAFLRGLSQTSLSGVNNLEHAFAGSDDMNQFSEFMGRWVLALAMTDRGVSQDSRYVYQPRVRDSDTQNWQGVCLSCDSDDNRGTTVSGVNLNAYYGSDSSRIDGSAAKFYAMARPKGNLDFSGTADGGNFGFLIRTR